MILSVAQKPTTKAPWAFEMALLSYCTAHGCLRLTTHSSLFDAITFSPLTNCSYSFYPSSHMFSLSKGLSHIRQTEEYADVSSNSNEVYAKSLTTRQCPDIDILLYVSPSQRKMGGSSYSLLIRLS